MTRRFSTVVADPPWPYATPGKGPLAAGTRSNKEAWHGSLTGNDVRARYKVMSIGEIQALPVDKVLRANAHLYLWTTNAFLVEAHEVARQWGFRPVTLITWTKMKAGGSSEPSMKTGYYFRGATEHVIFGVRGSLKLRSPRAVSTAFLHPRTPHSVKPEAFYQLVRRCSPGPYLELFARRARSGWAVWGDEVRCDIDLGDVTSVDACRDATSSSRSRPRPPSPHHR